MTDDSLDVGEVIDGRFRLLRLIGQGGMGSVWQARHLALDVDIAIKFLDPVLSVQRDLRARFAQEATAAARIRSPHVVTIFDYGFSDTGRPFIAMELLRGVDLNRRLALAGTLSVGNVVYIVEQACRGLSKAHALGIVHRDLKPANIFLVDEDDEEAPPIKLLDFGIAKAAGLGATTIDTETGQIIGTPLYMSPEQALGRPIDLRSDLYSMAVVAYRCLTGRTPFASDRPGELIVAVSTSVPPPASSLNPALPASLDAWFDAAFRKDPNARGWQTARALAESFELACRGQMLATPAAPIDLAPTLAAVPDAGRSNDDGVARGAAGDSSQPAVSGIVSTPPSRWRGVVPPLALTLSVGLLWARSERHVAAESTAVVSGAPLHERAPAAEPEAPPLVALRLGALPAHATLQLDGHALADNPIVVTRPREASLHRLRAEAPGFEPAEVGVSFEREDDVAVVLAPAVAASPMVQASPRRRVAPAVGSPSVVPAVAPPSVVPSALRAASVASPATQPLPAREKLVLDRGNPWKDP